MFGGNLPHWWDSCFLIWIKRPLKFSEGAGNARCECTITYYCGCVLWLTVCSYWSLCYYENLLDFVCPMLVTEWYPTLHHWTEMVLPSCAVRGLFLSAVADWSRSLFYYYYLSDNKATIIGMTTWTHYHLFTKSLLGVWQPSQSTKNKRSSLWSITESNECRCLNISKNVAQQQQGTDGS